MSNNTVPILSTKKLPESLIQSALQEGFKIDCIPFIETMPVSDNDLSKQINALAAKNINAIFTSGIAAKAVAAMLTEPPHWNIYCIHGQTLQHVKECFPQSVIAGTAGYGEDLAEEILKHKIKEAVFFCGNRRLNVLPTKLPAGNVSLKEYVVYRTELRPVKVDKTYKAILFYSPSGVQSFFSENTIANDVVLISIGNTTTRAIEKFCNNKIYTAHHASPKSMIEQLKQIEEWN